MHNLEMINQEVAPKTNMVEPAWAVRPLPLYSLCCRPGLQDIDYGEFEGWAGGLGWLRNGRGASQVLPVLKRVGWKKKRFTTNRK